MLERTEMPYILNDFIDFIVKTPSLIPRTSLPTSVFFLLSLSSFAEALQTWLLAALHALGYEVGPFVLTGLSLTVHLACQKD